MELISKDELEEIPDLYETERSLNPICHIKLFTPDAQWSWFIIEISKEDKSTCFGYVQGLDSELGYFSLEEIESVRGSLGLAVERDLLFAPTALSLVKRGKN